MWCWWGKGSNHENIQLSGGGLLIELFLFGSWFLGTSSCRRNDDIFWKLIVISRQLYWCKTHISYKINSSWVYILSFSKCIQFCDNHHNTVLEHFQPHSQKFSHGPLPAPIPGTRPTLGLTVELSTFASIVTPGTCQLTIALSQRVGLSLTWR